MTNSTQSPTSSANNPDDGRFPTAPTIPQTVYKPMHPEAANLARKHSKSFIEALILHAQSIAEEKEHEIVLTDHIRQALDFIRQDPKRKKSRDFIIFVSSTVLGFSAQSFVSEVLKLVASPPTGSVIAVFIYAIVTAIALLTAAIAILR